MRRHHEGALDIGIGEDDVGRLAAAFEGAALQIAGRELHDLARGGVAAGEGDLVDAAMGRKRGARNGAEARNDVEHAGREARLLDELGDLERRHRRLLGRLDDQRVAGRQSRTDLPRIEQDRRIPGQDGADHADRLPARIGQRVRLEGNLLALDLVGGAGEEDQPIDGALHLADRVAQGLAVVAAFQLRQPRGIAAHQLGELEEERAALARGDLGLPRAGHGGPGRRDGSIHVLFVGFGDFRPDRFGGRIDRGNRAPGMRRHPFPADIKTVICSHRHWHHTAAPC